MLLSEDIRMKICLFDFDLIDLCVLTLAVVLTLIAIFHVKKLYRKSHTQVIPFIVLYSISLLLLHFWWFSLPEDPKFFFTKAIAEMVLLTILVFVFTFGEKPEVKFSRFVGWGVFFGLISIGFTTLIFYIFTPSLSFEYIRQTATSRITIDHSITWNLIYFVVMALFEECWFRAGIQKKISLLVRSKHSLLISILVASLLFSICHMGILREEWIKILQIFVLGIFFGLAYHKGGLYSSMLAHSLLNLLFPFIELHLLY
jgi:membrane protease YdiL (CAAX protease family)